MIQAENLCKSYNGVPAVRDVSLYVPRGELCALLGPSGCGKSTLLRMLNALTPPDSGVVRINGQDIREAPPERLRRGIGYAVQSVGLFPHYTVEKIIALVPGLLRWPRERVKARVAELLSLMGLPMDCAKKFPRELSGGEAQRVGVARALAADPPVLLMDEPFGSVDPMGRDRLQRSFAQIQKTLRKTVLFVTHDVAEALLLGDRVALMREGRVVGVGTPQEMVLSPGDAFSRSFFGSDAALRLLSRHRAGEACQSGETDILPGCAVGEGATLAEAVSLMLVSGCVRLSVVRDGRAVGTLDFPALLRFFREGGGDAR
jgi:osmoprotectant transport system ATP-binding protein